MEDKNWEIKEYNKNNRIKYATNYIKNALKDNTLSIIYDPYNNDMNNDYMTYQIELEDYKLLDDIRSNHKIISDLLSNDIFKIEIRIQECKINQYKTKNYAYLRVSKV